MLLKVGLSLGMPCIAFLELAANVWPIFLCKTKTPKLIDVWEQYFNVKFAHLLISKAFGPLGSWAWLWSLASAGSSLRDCSWVGKLFRFGIIAQDSQLFQEQAICREHSSRIQKQSLLFILEWQLLPCRFEDWTPPRRWSDLPRRRWWALCDWAGWPLARLQAWWVDWSCANESLICTAMTRLRIGHELRDHRPPYEWELAHWSLQSRKAYRWRWCLHGCLLT